MTDLRHQDDCGVDTVSSVVVVSQLRLPEHDNMIVSLINVMIYFLKVLLQCTAPTLSKTGGLSTLTNPFERRNEIQDNTALKPVYKKGLLNAQQLERLAHSIDMTKSLDYTICHRRALSPGIESRRFLYSP